MNKRRLLILTKKELIELIRDPKIIVFMLLVPPLMFFAMGGMVSYTVQKTTTEIMKGVNVLVVNNDNEWASDLLIQTIKISPHTNITIINEEHGNITSKLNGPYSMVIMVPSNFTRNITENRRARIDVFYMVKGLSLSSTMKTEFIHNLLQLYQENLVKQWLKKAFPDKNPEILLHPLKEENYAVIKGRKVPSEFALAILNQSFLLILGPVFILSIGAALAAASIGVEKEEKTLETLLSLPVDRDEILISKAFGALIVALIGSASMGLGLYYYVLKILESIPTGAITLSIKNVIGLIGYGNTLLLGVSFFISLFLILILSIIISSFTNNIREAQAIAGYIWIPVILLIFMVMYINISSLSSFSQTMLSLTPFASPIIIAKEAFEGNTHLSYISLSSNTLYVILALFLGSKIFNSERILTSRIKLTFKKRRT